MLPTALHFSHQLLAEIILPNDFVVDATMGNGHDTLYLAQLVGPHGKVFAFDIQAQALAATHDRLLTANQLTQVQLIQAGHQEFQQFVPPDIQLKAAIFNLGYLPKSDKQIITQGPTTLAAIEQILTQLLPKGRIIVVAYYGHDGGHVELAHLQTFCETLPQENYQVMTYQFINQRNQPPILFCIEKK